VAAAYQEYLEFASQHPDIAAKHIGSNHPKCKPPQLYEELEQWVVVNKR